MLAIVSFGIPLGLALRDRVDAEVRQQASSQAELVAAEAGAVSKDPVALADLARRAGHATRGRVIVVNDAGQAIADSALNPQLGVSYVNRPEIAAALRGRTFQEERRSDTLNEDILATAVPVLRAGRPAGAVRVTQSVEAVQSSVRSSWLGLVLVGTIVLTIGLIAGIAIARRLSAPVRSLEAAALEVTGGNLERRATVEGTTEQRSLARSFNEMTARLAEALRSQSEFVADASHQLRTPLAGLRLRIEEVQAAGAPPDAEHELRAALREVDRLSETVDELLLLSRMGDRDQPGELVDLGEAARAAAARWAGAARERGMTVEVEAGGPAPAWCARADLERALDAVVENALAYSRDGGQVTIEVGPGRLSVVDRGPGFAAGEHEQVFQRFHRGSAGRAGPRGSGLGLPIARALMERWGGTARARDRDGGGAAVVLELPTAEGFASSLPAASANLPQAT